MKSKTPVPRPFPRSIKEIAAAIARAPDGVDDPDCHHDPNTRPGSRGEVLEECRPFNWDRGEGSTTRHASNARAPLCDSEAASLRLYSSLLEIYPKFIEVEPQLSPRVARKLRNILEELGCPTIKYRNLPVPSTRVAVM